MFAIFLVFGLIMCFYFKRSTGFPPGPKGWPIIGNIVEIRKIFERVGYHYLVWCELLKTYGPIVGLKLGKTNIILVGGMELIKEVSLREEFDGRPDGFFWKMRSRGKRLGVVFTDGALWIEHRRFSVMHLKNLGFGRSSMEDLSVEEVTSMIDWLKSYNSQPMLMNNTFDIPILNILWALISGKRYDRNDAKLQQVVDAVHDSFRVVDMSGGILNFIPALRYIIPKLSGYETIRDDLAHMYGFLTETIEDHKKTIKKGDDRDFIDIFLHEMESRTEENSTFTEEQLHVVCLDFLQAGADTTSNTLSFFILYMINYPNVQNKIHEEIDRVVGKTRKPRLLDKIRMPYVCAVLNEVQRIANVTPISVPHRALKDTQINGHSIPKGSIILMILHTMHMNKKWGDPEVFRPERFLDDNEKVIRHELFAPFGYGHRKCIGEILAKSNMFIFCTHLLQKFEVSRATGCDRNFDIFDGVVLTPKPFKVIWKPRI